MPRVQDRWAGPRPALPRQPCRKVQCGSYKRKSRRARDRTLSLTPTAPYATMCQHVGSHVARCKRDGVTDWSLALVVPARGQGRGLRPHSCRPNSSASTKAPRRRNAPRGALPKQLGCVVEALLHAPVPTGAGPTPLALTPMLSSKAGSKNRWLGSALCCQGGSIEQSEVLTFSASQRGHAFDPHSCNPIFSQNTARSMVD